MPRTLCRTRHVTGVACLRTGNAWAAKPRMPVTFDLRQEPGAGKPHAGICAGGGEQSPSLPRPLRTAVSALGESSQTDSVNEQSRKTKADLVALRRCCPKIVRGHQRLWPI